MNRNLDGVYFRVERDGKWKSICSSDMTKEELEKALEGWEKDQLVRLCIILAETIKGIGDTFDIIREEED